MADPVAEGDPARAFLTFGEACADFALLVVSQLGFPAKLDASGLCVGPATRGPVEDPAVLKLGDYTEYGKDDLLEVAARVDDRLGRGAQHCPDLVDRTGQHEQVRRIAGPCDPRPG